VPAGSAMHNVASEYSSVRLFVLVHMSKTGRGLAKGPSFMFPLPVRTAPRDCPSGVVLVAEGGFLIRGVLQWAAE
jgi:hypothetical protein